MSGGDIRNNVQYGLGPGLTFAVVAPRSGGRWKIVAFLPLGDREVGDNTHYGHCSGSNEYLSVALTILRPL